MRSSFPRLTPLAILLALETFAPVRSHEPRPYDEAEAAQAFYALKRAPVGQRAIPVERYLTARGRMRLMTRYSTRLGAVLRDREREQGSPDLPNLGSWTSLGPGNIGGRTRAILIDPGSPSTMYAAGVAGGVWKTTNAGTSWTPLTDLMASLAVSSMAMDPSNSSVLYAGTGEGYFNIDAVRGAGIFKSTNAGATWSQLGSTNNSSFYYVNDVVVSPLNPQRVYAATRTGVWRSTNGGSTWAQILNQASVNGCLDLALRTSGSNDQVLASCGSFAQATVHRNTNAGSSSTWSPVLTEANMGRTSLAIAPSNPSVVYALASSLAPGNFEYGLHAVFRSSDAGATWTATVRNTSATKLNTVLLSNPVIAFKTECGLGASQFLNQGWYDNVIAVDPADPNRVWAGGIDLFRSDNGGADWGLASYWWDTTDASYAHADQHALVFHPGYNGSGNQTLFVGNDGGIFRTDNARAATATGPTAACSPANSNVAFTERNNNYGVTQFYYGVPYPGGATYFGGTQDNGTIRGTDASGSEAWAEINGGDGGAVAVDPSSTSILYSENTGLSIQKSTNGGGSWSDATSGITGDNGFLFIAPFIMDPASASRLWTGGSLLWRTTNGASSWTQASAALGTTGSVSAVAVAPTDSNRVLAGKSGGAIHRTTTGLSSTASTSWPSAQPRTGYVSSLAFDPGNPSVAYATYSTFGGTHVWKSVNGGANWAGIDGTGSTGIPDVPVHAIVADPQNGSRLYVGTDLGVLVSADGGSTWSVESTGFASAVTEALVASGGKLFAFTHGRGAWRVSTSVASVAFASPSTSVGEASGTTALTVTLTTSDGQPTASTVTVAYASANGTATAGSDYTAVSGTLTFASGTSSGTTRTVNVPILSDGLDEANETFSVSLSNPVGGALGTPAGHTVTILDDDPPPALSIADLALNEGDTGTTTAVFSVSLSAASGQTVTVGYATADDTATAPSDFTTASGTLTFLPGTTVRTIGVPVVGETVPEADETFFVNLGVAVNATVADPQGVGTIVDDDRPGISIDDVPVAEGAGPGAIFTVSLSRASTQTVTVDFLTADGTAVAGDDYTTTSGTLTFAPGDLTKPISVPIAGDTLDEADETFFVNLSAPTNARLVDSQGMGTILDDDPPPSASIDDVSLTEGDAGTLDAVFTVSLSTASGQAVMVDYATANGTARAGADYDAASGTLTFDPATTTQTLGVRVNADTRDEADETYFVNLSGPVNVTLADAQGAGTILDDDPIPTISINDVSVAEGDAGTTSVFFSVRLSSPSGQTVSVDYATADGTAAAGSDYTAKAGSLTFFEGATTQPVAVAVRGDALLEGDEAFSVNLASPTNAAIADAQGLGTIVDDDVQPGLSVRDAAVKEGDAGRLDAVVQVSLSAPSAQTVTVDYATTDGSARAGLDYLARAGTLTLAPGETTATIRVPVLGDTLDERNEAVLVNLRSPVNARITRRQAQAAIRDDDGALDACQPILTAPFTISSQGQYCLARNLSTSVASGAAITIEADGVTLDLRGFTVRGTAGAGTQAFGVYASGRRNVTVKNGVLRGFMTGVFLGAPLPYATALGNLVQSVRVVESTWTGIWVQGRGNSIFGDQVVGTTGTSVFGADADVLGIVADGPEARLMRNEVSETTGVGQGSGYGISVVNGDGTLVALNRIGNSGLGQSTGILVGASTGVAVSYNRLTTLDLGIVFTGGATGRIQGNAFTNVVTPSVGP